MSRAELAIIVGIVLCAIGAGLFHPGAGLLVGGLGLASYGVAEIRFPEPSPTDPSAEAES